ncbi:MAG: acetyl-CoA carboxylase biotin carboxyl carrier protein subunit [Pyrinomonadaceae bacterium]|nr:acetyl-CoA carboxylase biotin carboxyl carrier protein subunit [Pyrinomonadaceae bacterium]
MKLKAQLAGLEHDVSIELNAGTVGASAEVDGRPYEVVVRELAKGQYLLLVDGRVYKARVDSRPGSRGANGLFDVAVGGHTHEITIVDPKRLRTGETTTAHSRGAAQIISPMPGKIVRVLVEPGAQVEAGEGVVVVEAMKMQNEMKAPKAGTVVSINAEVGATVSAGDVLAVIE